MDDVDIPTPDAGEILIEVHTASINLTNAKCRTRGLGPFLKTTGSDFAGIVWDVRCDVDSFDLGDRVSGTGLHTTQVHQRSFAEYVSALVELAAPLPDGVSFEGAAVALVGVTTW